MKELSIEEKARRYDEALERAKQFSEKPYLEDSKGIVEYIFPALKESEDERIRKELIGFLRNIPNSNYTCEEMALWLEKQGEQKPTQEIEPTPIFKIGDILKRKGKDYTFRVDRIQGGYYHCDRNHGAFFPIEEQGNWELVEQKPAAWSEEDEKMLYHIICDIESLKEGLVYCKSICDEEITWLKSLKDRVQLQPQNKWIGVDKEVYVKEPILAQKKDKSDPFGGFVVCCDHTLTPNVYERYMILGNIVSQNTWKPSDEQMEALDDVIDEYDGYPEFDSLVSLKNDLKKLREK